MEGADRGPRTPVQKHAGRETKAGLFNSRITMRVDTLSHRGNQRLQTTLSPHFITVNRQESNTLSGYQSQLRLCVCVCVCRGGD